ncbi:DNA polymerase I [Candidatus Arthromitus sp. SFB-rat-Yit]|uniref:DNA polymerase I n=1 Tax=Candidatus Arthromitus sp. SFB-rat-Yit TaxID=1041504 RepID=UPI000227A1E6|nr:DNA polymerase I [Candidatus Arthromitus sp. SFB-rat-Yit]BAK80763.1 DNA polymerase I [Candidatus Arthromitus sp. SFB-rat-Yit]
MERVLILDSNSILNRAFYALPLLSCSEGIHTNGILGYLTMFFKMQEEFNATYVIATFDRKAKTFRHLEYENYKAGRKSMPNELFEQIEPLKEILRAMNINIFELDGFEADDLIGTLSRIYEENGFEPIIVTGDKDALQLSSSITKVIITKKGITDKEVYDEKKMIEVYGVTPIEFIDVKAIMGDKSDNIPGVPGIGEKGATSLIKEFKSIENLYKNLENLKEGKIKKNLINGMELAFLSKKLSKINRFVPIEFSIEDIKAYGELDSLEVYELYNKYELKSLLNKIDINSNEGYEKDILFDEVSTLGYLRGLINKIYGSDKNLYIYCKVLGSKVSEIRLGDTYINFDNENYIIKEKFISENFDEVSRIFSSKNKKICFDSKMIYKVMFKNSKEVNNMVFDLVIGDYLLNPGKECTILSLCSDYVSVYLDRDKEYLGISFFEKIYEIILGKIKNSNMMKLYFEIEHPLSLILASIELYGFRVSIKMLEELREKFDIKIKEHSDKIYNLSGEVFNINSPKQLGKILFEKLDLPIIKKTKTGYSTNAEVLEALIDKHEIIEEIINYRQITKLQSTYILGLMDVIDDDLKVHTSFNQTLTTTGRLSSVEPNLQNIPVKYPLGREIRKAFVAEENSYILSADYSQIELRMLAHISGDEIIIKAFRENLDIHRMTASEIFSVDENDVTSEMRNRCKAVNFGIIYGISDFALSNDLKISRKEAREYMDKYFNRYVGVKKYLDEIIVKGKEDGFVTTIFNRRRDIPEIRSSNKIIKSLGERLAMNTPIQGSAADIIKLAMIKVYNRLNEENLKSKIILQVHDELVLNVYEDELEKVSLIVKEEMELCYEDISVPLRVNLSYGKNWFEAK